MPFLHSSPELKIKRRSTAELLAYTVNQLFPHAYLLGGGETSFGFFYDFVFEQAVDEGLLALIEVNLRTLVKEGRSIQSLSIMRENAQALLTHHEQPFLAELAGESDQNIIDLLQIDKFYGVCQAPLLASTDEAGFVKLLQLTTRQEESDDGYLTITRITGTSFADGKTLKQFIKLHDNYFKRKDHRLLGPELDLFSCSDQLSEIEYSWHPKGAALRRTLQDWLEAELQKKESLQKVHTPLVLDYEKIKDFPCSLEPFEFKQGLCGLSPSRLPQHLYLYKSRESKRVEASDRFFEWASIYQRQSSPLTEGLLGSVCQLVDQTTIFCSHEQLSQEFISSLQFIEQIIRIFGFEAQWYLAASRQKSVKARQERQVLNWIKQTIQSCSLSYPFQDLLLEDDNLEGPRLTLRLADEMGREWTGPALTIVTHGIDNNAEKAKEGSVRFPAILIRHVWGSLERLIALLIERWEGCFPLWFAPEQVRVLAIGELAHSYAKEVEASCRRRGLRVNLDLRIAKLGEKIHTAEKERIPYLLIVGDQEVKKQSITVRSIRQPGRSESVKLEEFLDQIHQECLCPTLVG